MKRRSASAQSPQRKAESRFYFVCACGAKWFANLARSRCPRCGRAKRSSEKLPVPWLIDAGSSTTEAVP